VDSAAQPTTADPGRYDAFLSYAREDGDFVVGWLRSALAAQAHEVRVDVDIIGGAQLQERVRRGIEGCKAFIFVVSPARLGGVPGRTREAVALHKLILPVIYRDAFAELMP
jgi:hypothetical protein